MIKYTLFAVIFLSIMFTVNLPAENQTSLPPIDKLNDLPVELVADFTDHDGIASHALPIVGKDGIVFFFDSRHHQLFRTSIKDKTLFKVSRSGEGPKEYYYVLSLFRENNLVFLIDSKQKLLCFDINGKYQWEERLGMSYTDIVGKKGDTFYFSGESLFTRKEAKQGIYAWQKGKKRQLIHQLPQSVLRTTAIVYGKRVEGGGIIYISLPSFCIDSSGNRLFSASGNRYGFTISDLNGKQIKIVQKEMGVAELSNCQKSYKKMMGEKVFSIMDIFYHHPYILVISNYFKDNKPRVDCFSPDGEYKKSFLMPVHMEIKRFRTSGNCKSARISNGFLVFMDPDEVGFKIFQIKTL